MGEIDRESLPFEPALDQLGQPPFVFDHEYPHIAQSAVSYLKPP
jgi:hypothetical protein